MTLEKQETLITITILDIIHHPVFYLKQRFGERILFLASDGTYLVGHKQVSNSGHQQQHQTRFMKPIQHKAPMKDNIFQTFNLHTCDA
jgi:hypothetical protein